MTSRNSVIRVYWIKDPSKCEYSHTNNVKQRILAIQADIKAVNGQTKRPIYDRWLKFQNLPYDEIHTEIFSSVRSQPLFGDAK